MQLIEIFSAIEKIAPLDAAAPWDISGLQVAAVSYTHLTLPTIA